MQDDPLPLRLVTDNNLDRFSLEWRRAFAEGRANMRLMESDFERKRGNDKEADRQFLEASRIRP